MKCDEAQTLHGPYLDSELDAKTSLEIQQHLKMCPACARLFAEADSLPAGFLLAFISLKCPFETCSGDAAPSHGPSCL